MRRLADIFILESLSRARRLIRWLFVWAGAFLLAGCGGDHIQSTLHPVSPPAEQIAWLWWFMFAVLTGVFVIVIALLGVAVFKGPTGGPGKPALGNRFIVVSGIILPAIVLVVLLVFSVQVTVALKRPAEGLTIEVIGHQWWWEVRYPEQNFTIANEIYIPVGKPVRLELTASDVIHSFWAPNLQGKMDMIPGHTNLFWFQADRPGTWRGQCAEYCGLQHALMAFMVVALPEEEFEEWLERRQEPPPEPETDLLRRGLEVLVRQGCADCHAVAGTEAVGRIGPELTDIGSRLTLGAATLPNNHGNLAGWIANPQPLKPGNKMPPTYLSSEELHALMAYLESLR